jgi:hypothetical protein
MLIRLAWLLSLALFVCACPARAYDVLCRNGNTGFEAYFYTGVQANVGPPVQGRLAVRKCRAILAWADDELTVAADAAEIDLDMFGIDPGLGHLVAAFQIKHTEAECCMTYKIYSLEQPPQLLRTLRGGGYFSGADSNLDSRVEIWTDDAAAVDGFEGFRVAQMQFPPTCVLRFEHGRLLDVSSEFQPYFDQEIASLRAKMNLRDLQRFKLSDGKQAVPGASPDGKRVVVTPLLAVKEQVLELVWAYLYSNREKRAWQSLAEMWPAADLQRIRSAIMQARSRGMRSQVDAVSDTLPPLEVQQSKIYDSTKTPARPIMVRFYPPAGTAVLREKLRVDLVVDFAGKVWSVRVRGKNKAAYDAVKRSTANWKFIPAFVDKNAVASRLRMTISLEQ